MTYTYTVAPRAKIGLIANKHFTLLHIYPGCLSGFATNLSHEDLKGLEFEVAGLVSIRW